MLFNRQVWFSKMTLRVAPIAMIAAVAAVMMGCPKTEYRALNEGDNVKNLDDHGHSHDHEHGPNGGHILELGPHHGEITVAADKTVTVYILDGAAKNPVAVEGAVVEVHIHQATGEDVVLALNADPLESEKDGKSSRFSAKSALEPNPVTDLEHLEGKVTLKIGDETHTADLEHGDDHDHDHDH